MNTAYYYLNCFSYGVMAYAVGGIIWFKFLRKVFVK